MQWQFLTVLVLALPLIILPVALVWYVNIGLVSHTTRRIGRRHAAQRDERRKMETLVLANTNQDRYKSTTSTGWEYIDTYLSSASQQIECEKDNRQQRVRMDKEA